jgi:hypothetical protein
MPPLTLSLFVLGKYFLPHHCTTPHSINLKRCQASDTFKLIKSKHVSINSVPCSLAASHNLYHILLLCRQAAPGGRIPWLWIKSLTIPHAILQGELPPLPPLIPSFLSSRRKHSHVTILASCCMEFDFLFFMLLPLMGSSGLADQLPHKGGQKYKDVRRHFFIPVHRDTSRIISVYQSILPRIAPVLSRLYYWWQDSYKGVMFSLCQNPCLVFHLHHTCYIVGKTRCTQSIVSLRCLQLHVQQQH